MKKSIYLIIVLFTVVIFTGTTFSKEIEIQKVPSKGTYLFPLELEWKETSTLGEAGLCPSLTFL